MFREVADIQTADMLKLPVPAVKYHNIKTKPSEIQTELVASLAKRAEKVRARLVEPNVDNMLKITNDVILSRLVDTFSSRILYPMRLPSGNYGIAVV